MSKAISRMRVKKVVGKVDHSSKLRTHIPAGMAGPQPPLGTQLGQRHINVQNFCAAFNEMTKNHKRGVPVPTRVEVLPDNKFNIEIASPPSPFLLKQAAGIQKGKFPGEILAGKITHKHLYEIAYVKSKDYRLQLNTVQQICDMLIRTARNCGIEIVRELDPEEYREFLRQRQLRYDAYILNLQEEKASKLLRVKG